MVVYFFDEFFPTVFGYGFVISVVVSFVAWSIMKVWRLFTDIVN